MGRITLKNWGCPLTAALLFLAIKLPACFVANNPEELRDFDHFLQAAGGALAYHDFVWLYGPLTPLIYGFFYKFIPSTLFAARILDLLLWSVATGFIAWALRYWIRSGLFCVGAALAATIATGYPGYSHNHILPAVSLVFAAFWFCRYLENRKTKELTLSFLGVMVCLFCRPFFTGIGACFAFVGLLFWYRAWPGWKAMRGCIGILSVAIIGCFAVYRDAAFAAFLPQEWAILPEKAYPNLSALAAFPKFNRPDWYIFWFKQVRAALETGLFYLHYFVWPAFLLGWVAKSAKDSRLRAAFVLMAFGWAGSWDLLHYGFADPFVESALWARGQYFITLTVLSIILFWSVSRSRVAFATLGAFTTWGLMPFGMTLGQLASFPVQPPGIRSVAGIRAHPDREPIFQAVRYINERCTEKDYVVAPQYSPGISRLLKCQDLFAQDSYIFTRGPSYRLKPGETPYQRAGGKRNEDIIDERVAANSPKFYLFQTSESHLLSVCNRPGWRAVQFGAGATGAKVCWAAYLHH